MTLGRLQTRFARIFTQRCFLLFAALLVLVLVAPFVAGTFRGRLIVNAAQALVLIAAVAAVGRSPMPFGIGLLLGIPAVAFQFFAQVEQGEAARYVAFAQAFFFAFYIIVVAYLLQYVFNPQVMTEDKLFGAAACYMMLGILWAYAYNLLLYFDPQSFAAGASKAPPAFYDLLYMSFGLLTSNGPGEYVPVGAKARALVIVEEVSGTLFAAILIARLAGIYPPSARENPTAPTP